MTIGLRGKLFAVSIGLVLAGVAAAGLFLENELRERLERGIEHELTNYARAARELVQAGPREPTLAEIDALTDRLGATIGLRLTIIDGAGRVLGDSEISLDGVEAMENHTNRPEVLAAKERGHGSARRYSTTIDTDLLYVAIPFGDAHPGWIARAARPLADVDDAITRLRQQMLVAGLIAMLAAGAMSLLMTRWMLRTLRQLAENARAIARGERRTRIEVGGSDELGRLAGSLNAMSEHIEATVAELASERERFEAVLEAMAEGVIALDGERRVTLMNPAALAMLGLPEVPVGRALVDLVRVPALHELIADRAERAGSAELDLGVGQRRILAQVSPQRAGGGSVVVMHDISELRRLETIRRDFVANVSHELRTPVSIVQANTETLLGGALDDPAHARPMLEALHRNAQRMSDIITDLLDLSRLEAGRHQLASERVSVAAAAARARESVEGAAARRDTRLEVLDDEGIAVRADAKALEQVLINLLDNAVKHTPSGGRVTVAARATDTGVRIEVRDTGPGIAARHQERVFERFYRIDPGRSRDMGGTGLGLAIVKHLVEAMNGSVGVTNGQAGGAVFWVELPAGARGASPAGAGAHDSHI